MVATLASQSVGHGHRRHGANPILSCALSETEEEEGKRDGKTRERKRKEWEGGRRC